MSVQKEKKVALTTWFAYHNYGTALQVSSLYRIINDLGYNIDVVNYLPKKNRTIPPQSLQPEELFGETLSKTLRYLPNNRSYSSIEREQLFEKYLAEHLTFTNPCPTMAELEGLNDSYGTFVCGSDQIWAPSVFDPHYFLDFAGDDRLKIAYAPSVGLPQVDNPDVAHQMAQLCGRIDTLSTREESGSRIISRLTGRNTATVLDPTLLVSREDWLKTAIVDDLAPEKPYLLAYMLGKNEAQWRRIYTLARRLGLTVQIIPVFQCDLKRKGCITEPIGPHEFVSLIARASYVCTDSFHGIAFSINLERNFCAFERFKKSDLANQNSRIYNILDKIGLQDRLTPTEVMNDQPMEPINWERSRKQFTTERQRSLSWLRAALAAEPRQITAKNNIEYNRTLCCGCTACVTTCPVDAITVSLDSKGFWRARVDKDACTSCGRCRRVCPFVEHSFSKSVTKGSLFSYKCSDTRQLLSSSSGGAGAVIAKNASSAGVTVLGCAFDTKKGGAASRIVEPSDTEGLASLAGSKYMQSQVGDALTKAATHKNPIFITGTPCQVAAAKNLLGGRDDITYVDLVCHGVPTKHLYERYKEWLTSEYDINSERTKTIFRYKLRSWRERYIYSTDGVHEACLHQRRDPYFLIFEAEQCYAPCCYECPWRATSAADVRLGDYWGPRFKGDRTGVSMLLALTDRGREIVRTLSDTGEVTEQPLDDYMRYQQIENLPKPVFYDKIITKLADSRIGIRSVCDEFAEPVAKYRDLHRKLEPLIRLAKRFLGKS